METKKGEKPLISFFVCLKRRWCSQHSMLRSPSALLTRTLVLALPTSSDTSLTRLVASVKRLFMGAAKETETDLPR